MNKYLHRIIWSKVRVCWVVVCESASAVSGGRPRRARARRGVALSVAVSIALPSFSPLALAAPGFTSPAPRPAAENAAPTSSGKDGKDGKEKQPSGLESTIARSVQGMARAQAQQRPNDPSALKQQSQSQINQFLQGGVQAARDTGLPFLRNLQGGLRYDFYQGRTSFELQSIDEVYRSDKATGLLQFGLHNDNNRMTGSSGAVLRHEVAPQWMLGANSFLDYEFSKQHTRGSLGLEAIAPQFTVFSNAYIPLSGWRGAKRNDRREEKPASGMDVGVKLHPSFLPGLGMKLSYFRWNGAEVDFFDSGRTTQGASGLRYGIDYRPVPLVSVGLEQTRVQGGEFQTRMQVGVSFNLSEPLSKQLQRQGHTPGSMERQRMALVEREHRMVLNTRGKVIILALQVAPLTVDALTGQVTLTGQTQAGSTVTIIQPDLSVQTVIADAQGRFSFVTAAAQPAGAFQVQASNRLGDQSATVVLNHSGSAAADTLAVAVLGVATDPVNRSVAVKGRTLPNLRVNVLFTDGSRLVTQADDKGLFQARSSGPLPTGDILLDTVNPASSKTASAKASYLTPDTPAPTIDEVRTAAGDGRVTVMGRADPGANLDVSFPDRSVERVRVGASGSYEVISLGRQSDGELRVTRVPGPLEKAVYRSYAYGVGKDLTAPAAPVIARVVPAPGRLTVVGTAEPGATVEVVFPDGQRERVKATEDGAYSVSLVADRFSNGKITAQATDAAGNRSPVASFDYPPVDTALRPPQIGLVQTDPATGRVTVTGTAAPNADVTVRFPGGSEVVVRAGPDGRYSATSATDIPSGDIRVTASDGAGNGSPPTIRNYVDEVDVTAAVAPTIVRMTETPGTGVLTVVGRAEPGSTVTVNFPDGTTANAVATPAGDYSVSSAGDMVSGPVRAVAVNPAGNRSPEVTANFVDSIDRTAPGAPLIDTVTTAPGTGLVTVSGTAEPGSTVTVAFPDGTRGTATASGTGLFAITSTADMVAGDISVTAADAAGNVSPPTIRNYADAADITPPLAPVIDSTVTAPGTGVLTVSGTAEPGSSVTVTFPDGTTATVPAAADGRYTASSATDMVAGDIRVRARDAAGNDSPVTTRRYDDVVDVTAPAVPTIVSMTETPGTGLLTVSGRAEPGSTVTVTFPDATTVDAIATPAGDYSATSAGDMVSGLVRAVAVDAARNRSPEATANFVDSVVAAPASAPVILSAVAAPDGRVTVTGTAPAGATVTVRFPGGDIQTVVAAGDGRYTVVSAGNVPSGDITATAARAGGAAGPTATHAYVDTTPPAVPVIERVTTDPVTGIVTISGTAEPDSRIEIGLPGGGFEFVAVGPDGRFTASSPTDIGSGDITAVASDLDGNRSRPATHAYVDTVDLIAPAAPVITTVETHPATGIVTVTGTAEPLARVTVVFPSGARQVVNADAAGAYIVSSPGDETSGIIVANATDAANNVSRDTRRNYADTTLAAPAVTTVVTDGVGRVTVSGTAAPGSTVSVAFPGDSRPSTGVVGSGGDFSVTSIGNVTDGDISLTVTRPGGTSIPTVHRYVDTFTDFSLGDVDLPAGQDHFVMDMVRTIGDAIPNLFIVRRPSVTGILRLVEPVAEPGIRTVFGQVTLQQNGNQFGFTRLGMIAAGTAPSGEYPVELLVTDTVTGTVVTVPGVLRWTE